MNGYISVHLIAIVKNFANRWLSTNLFWAIQAFFKCMYNVNHDSQVPSLGCPQALLSYVSLCPPHAFSVSYAIYAKCSLHRFLSQFHQIDCVGVLHCSKSGRKGGYSRKIFKFISSTLDIYARPVWCIHCASLLNDWSIILFLVTT